MARTIYDNGRAYATLHDSGQIERLDGAAGPSPTWTVTGALRLNNFGRVVERYSLADVLAGGIAWLHNNGKQRVHLTDLDLDHGRMWWSPTHHVV